VCQDILFFISFGYDCPVDLKKEMTGVAANLLSDFTTRYLIIDEISIGRMLDVMNLEESFRILFDDGNIVTDGSCTDGNEKARSTKTRKTINSYFAGNNDGNVQCNDVKLKKTKTGKREKRDKDVEEMNKNEGDSKKASKKQRIMAGRGIL